MEATSAAAAANCSPLYSCCVSFACCLPAGGQDRSDTSKPHIVIGPMTACPLPSSWSDLNQITSNLYLPAG